MSFETSINWNEVGPELLRALEALTDVIYQQMSPTQAGILTEYNHAIEVIRKAKGE